MVRLRSIYITTRVKTSIWYDLGPFLVPPQAKTAWYDLGPFSIPQQAKVAWYDLGPIWHPPRVKGGLSAVHG